jgi:histidyl-tRNA synthetase
MSTQPARGMRDFLPDDVRRREYVVRIIKDVYDRYGFEPLETPAAENIETLLGKYGEEGSKLIFKILKRGEREGTGEADLALRYDLTVPLARVVAEYQSRLPRVFKRYQIQPVWRADRPARGRFREFYQCDIDTIGSTSPVAEAEQIAAASEILMTLGFEDFVIRVNHRKFLAAWLRQVPVPDDRHADVLVTIDKVDKIGRDGVAKELADKQYGAEEIAGITRWIGANHPPEWVDSAAAQFDPGADTGLENLRRIVQLTSTTAARGRLRVDPALARGLGYYTGAIMEVNVKDLPGSIAAGGRYDNLIGAFSGGEIPACGFSLGLERILVVMQERGMFPAAVEKTSVDVVVAALEEAAQPAAMETAAELRRSGSLRVDLYPDVSKKMDRIFKYVDQRRARFIAILGGNEVADGTVSLRNVASKTTETVKRGEAAAVITRAARDQPDPSASRERSGLQRAGVGPRALRKT